MLAIDWPQSIIVFFVNGSATTQIYTLSLHDALPISRFVRTLSQHAVQPTPGAEGLARYACTRAGRRLQDRKSTRLNSSHVEISYAVFCLKKKNKSINNLERWLYAPQ